jgi:DNA replication licensing factor MCM4
VYAYDYLVDHVKPGDRVEITGIYKARPVRVSRSRRTMRAFYPTFLYAINFRKLNKQKKNNSADG